jgi:hypothetical protein
MIKSRGYTGSVIQLRRVVAALRPVSLEAFLRLSTLPGEQAQADWAHFGEVTIGRAKGFGSPASCLRSPITGLRGSSSILVEFAQRPSGLYFGN